MKTAALNLAIERAFHIFPVAPPHYGGPSAGKRPLIKSWQNLATDDPDTIREWWDRWPDASIGVATGLKSRVFVLDVDLKTGGADSLDNLRKQVADWPESLMARTGSGGLHLYFQHDPLHPVFNSTSALAPGLDIRGEGGFVVAPPSLHISGNRYEWMN